MESITAEEYNAVLRYYDIDATGMTSKQRKRRAEDILATKLCRCIKKVEDKVEEKSQAIAICTESVISKKDLKVSGFKCDKKKKVKGLSRRRRSTEKRKTKRSGKKGRKSRRAPGRSSSGK